MLDVTTDGQSLYFGMSFAVNCERTIRIPDDGRTYPLPPGLDSFPVYHVKDYADRLPREWVEHGGVFIPMYQREALWISFEADYEMPHAVKIASGKINAVSGKPWDQGLSKGNHDYLVSPPQPWIDGFNAGEGLIRQFVAMPLGMGYTVEGQVTGKEEFGGLQIIVYAPKPGRFPQFERDFDVDVRAQMAASSVDMGLGAGGRMKQKLYPDEHGIDTWDQDNYGRAYVHIVNSMMFREVTGLEPPATPVTAKTYAEHGLPWFDIYDEGALTMPTGEELKGVKSIKEMDQKQGFNKPQQDDEPIEIPDNKVIGYQHGRRKVQDSKW